MFVVLYIQHLGKKNTLFDPGPLALLPTSIVTLISTIISVLALTLNILGIHYNTIMHLHLFLLIKVFLVADM